VYRTLLTDIYMLNCNQKHDGGSNAPSLGGDQSSLRKALAAPWTPVEIGLNSQTEQEMSNSPENLSANLLSIDHEEFHSDGLYGEEASLVQYMSTSFFVYSTTHLIRTNAGYVSILES
jgi:hypothetical protein